MRRGICESRSRVQGASPWHDYLYCWLTTHSLNSAVGGRGDEPRCEQWLLFSWSRDDWYVLSSFTCLHYDLSVLMTWQRKRRGGGGGQVPPSTSHQTHTTKHHKFTLTLNPPSLQKKTTDVVIQQHTRKLLMMEILMPETCSVHKKQQSRYRPGVAERVPGS